MKKNFIAIALFVSLSANAEVFKCADAEGKTVYQSTTCPNDKGYFVDLDKNTKISVEEYKKNKEQEEARIKQELEAVKKREEQQANSSSTYTSSTYSSGRSIHTGPRGGRYYYNGSGNKTYVKRK